MQLLDVFEGDVRVLRVLFLTFKEYARVTATMTTLGTPHSKDDVSLNRKEKPTGTTTANVYVWSGLLERLEPRVWR